MQPETLQETYFSRAISLLIGLLIGLERSWNREIEKGLRVALPLVIASLSGIRAAFFAAT